jgi:PAS domain S-box-containing protein/putative nucleotidyltransferase with HDIG domain
VFEHRSKFALRLTGIYLVFGLIWILATDFLVESMQNGGRDITSLQTYKGSIFVVLSALLLFIVVQREISARARTRQRLRLIDSAVENIQEGVLITSPILDDDGPVIEYVNQAMSRITGYSKEELVGQMPAALVGDRTDMQMVQRYREEMRNGNVAVGQTVNYRKDGSAYIAAWQTVPLYDDQGILTHYVTTHRDVTHQHEVENQLRTNEQRFRSLFDMNPDAVFGLDTCGRIESLNPAAIKMFDYPQDEVIGKKFSELIAPDVEDDASARFRRVLAGESLYYDTNYISRTGERLDIEGLALPIMIDDEVTGVFGLMKDVSRRNRSERQLLLQLRRLDALHAIDRAITTGGDLSDTLDDVLGEIVKLLGVDAGAIAVMDNIGSTLTYMALNGIECSSHVSLVLDDISKYEATQRAIQMVRIVSNISDTPEHLLHPELFADQQYTKYISAPLISKGSVEGIIELFFRGDAAPDLEWFNMLDSLVTQAAIAIDNGRLFSDLQQSNQELRVAYQTTLEGWARALEMRDDETEGHSQRVTWLTVELARRLGVPDDDLVPIRRGALLHDIGKMAIPDSILSKPGPLTDDEWKIMRRHPEHGRRMLEDIEFLHDAIDIPYAHHERWDGTGYPHGLSGTDIPLAARIFAVVDVWDALLSDRPYRKAWDIADVREHIRLGAGSHFDPDVATAFLSMMESGIPDSDGSWSCTTGQPA